MNKDLIIVESPAKVKTIRKFLGPDYEVGASVGHVRDLPKKVLGVDEQNDFSPDYEVIPGKHKVVSQLKKLAAKADQIFLAPDPDREGEAIAWHVAELIKDANTKIRRIQFNEITARAVREALKHPRDLNLNLFNAQQARRVLDRLVGYKLSPLLWQKIKRGISAGRVQSVALRLIVDRERERQAFIPKEYWVFKVSLEVQKDVLFEADLWKVSGKKPDIGSAEQALALEQAVRQAPFAVESVVEKERQRQPGPPFITSTLQQEASRRFSYPAKRTMSLAQRLYEGVELGDKGIQALITYMRTDSVRIAPEALKDARQLIQKTFGQEYCPEKARVFKSRKSAQEAHEAIRPVDVHLTPKMLESYLPRDMFQLYKLIWTKFVASQMAAARFWDTTVTVAAGSTQWRAKGERLIFPGYLAVYGNADPEKSQELPPLSSKQELRLQELFKEQKFTQPPPRYSEASLIRELEEKGIGRPSTYAQIISTLLDREYVTQVDRQFVPLELGSVVSDQLTAHFTKLMDVDFTAQMEESLDQVAAGKQDWVSLMRSFTGEFYPILNKAKKDMAAVKAGVDAGLPCPECAKPLLIKFGKAGPFLACTGYPDCSFTGNFTRDESGAIKTVEKLPREEPVKVGTCPDCGGDVVLKKARTGSRFFACTSYPKCKYTQSYSTGVPCPAPGCTGELVERSSRFGSLFYSCSRYPDCTTSVPAPPVAQSCPKCGYPVMVKRHTEKRGNYLSCPQKTCRHYIPIEEDQAVQEPPMPAQDFTQPTQTKTAARERPTRTKAGTKKSAKAGKKTVAKRPRAAIRKKSADKES
ncbi:MAG TPA: type I DNA topoisomerase [Desulfonatronum sp.]|nr:type I DNA topoisomerase [Desulfonatronum sp.]